MRIYTMSNAFGCGLKDCVNQLAGPFIHLLRALLVVQGSNSAPTNRTAVWAQAPKHR